MKILFLTRNTWYSKIMANYILRNFPNSKIINKPVKKINKKYDYIIAIGYQKIISDQILNKAKIKALNIHPGSIYNLGAGCYSYPIFNKDKFSGVTCHELTSKPDRPVLIEKRFPLYSNDDFTSLQGRTLVTVLKYFMRLWTQSLKKLPISKINGKETKIPKKLHDLLTINLKKDTKIIKLKVMSANPLYPGPYIEINGKKLYEWLMEN